MVERLVIMVPGDAIGADDLPPPLRPKGEPAAAAGRWQAAQGGARQLRARLHPGRAARPGLEHDAHRRAPGHRAQPPLPQDPRVRHHAAQVSRAPPGGRSTALHVPEYRDRVPVWNFVRPQRVPRLGHAHAPHARHGGGARRDPGRGDDGHAGQPRAAGRSRPARPPTARRAGPADLVIAIVADTAAAADDRAPGRRVRADDGPATTGAQARPAHARRGPARAARRDAGAGVGARALRGRRGAGARFAAGSTSCCSATTCRWPPRSRSSVRRSSAAAS